MNVQQLENQLDNINSKLSKELGEGQLVSDSQDMKFLSEYTGLDLSDYGFAFCFGGETGDYIRIYVGKGIIPYLYKELDTIYHRGLKWILRKN